MTDLVLIGGGHSHAIALAMWARYPLSGVRLTLISDVTDTPYSGMLPGYIAGFYSYEETHIDLRRLAQFAGANLLLDRAIGLDLQENRVICQNLPPVKFDYLSIDIGSTPNSADIPGAASYATPAKPVPQFLASWQQITTQVRQNPEKKLIIALIGGGAGGVELALNMQTYLHAILQEAKQTLSNLQIHLCHRNSELLPNHNQSVRRILTKILKERDIQLHLGENVIKIEANQVICQSGLKLNCDIAFLVTQASAPSWITASGLATDAQGFILVSDTLQSVSHPHILAAGDIATMEGYTRPKAGVFAVRQGKPLFNNLQALILGKKLQLYHPQSKYLALIGTGDQRAIASWGNFGLQSSWFWHGKDYIDRQFMQRFRKL